MLRSYLVLLRIALGIFKSDQALTYYVDEKIVSSAIEYRRGANQAFCYCLILFALIFFV